jgi:hypothetical protein
VAWHVVQIPERIAAAAHEHGLFRLIRAANFRDLHAKVLTTALQDV